MPLPQVYIVTFNCARSLVDPATLGLSLLDASPGTTAALPDIVAISLQEVAPIAYAFIGGSYLRPYYDRVADALGHAALRRGADAKAYLPIVTKNVGMTALMLFATTDAAVRISGVETAAVGVGLWDMGNKGAVAAHFNYTTDEAPDSIDFTFVAAHLAPMEDAFIRRNKDWENIVRNLVFVPEPTPRSEAQPLLVSRAPPRRRSSSSMTTFSQLYHEGSYVFLAGDLNYRTRDISPGPDAYNSFPQPSTSDANARHYSHLLYNDQLQRELAAGRTAHGFQEAPITFPPTYKYSGKQRALQDTAAQQSTDSSQDSDANGGAWSWAKHRWPSWCDRILFLPSLPGDPELTVNKYTSLPTQQTSDHQPVALSVTLSPETNSHPSNARDGPPFSANLEWKARLEASRQKELAVGTMAFLVLTREGISASIVTALIAATAWYLFANPPQGV